MQRQFAVDAAGEGLGAIGLVVDADDVVAVAGVDRGGAGNALDVDHVVAAVDHRRLVTAVEEGDPGVGGFNEEIVVVVRQPDLEFLEAGIGDTQGQAHAGDLVRAQAAVFLRGVAGVVDAQAVGVASATVQDQAGIDGVDVAAERVEQGGDGIDLAGGAADTHDVAAGAGADSGFTGDRLDVEDVKRVAACDAGDRTAAVRALDGEHVAVGGVAQADIERFQRAVGDAAVDAQQALAVAADDAVADAGGAQGGMVVGGVAGVVEVEQIVVGTALAVHRQQRIDVVERAAGIGVGLAEVAQRRLAADVDRVAAVAGIERRAGVLCQHRETIVAAAAVDLDVVDALVGDLHAHRQQPGLAAAELHGLDRRHAAGVVDVEAEAVGRVAAGDHQAVAAVGAGGEVENLDPGRAFGRHRHQDVLRRAAVVGSVPQDRVAAEIDHRDRGIADLDAAVEVVDDEGIVAAAAADPRHFENVVDVLDDGIGGEAVTGVDELVGGVLAGLERRVAGAVQQVADHQLVVVEADVGGEGLAAQAEVLD